MNKKRFNPSSSMVFPGRYGRRSLLALAAAVCIGATAGFRCGKKPTPPAAPATSGVPHGPAKSLRQQIEKVTGGHTRIVWARDYGEGKDTFANGTKLALMGLDTRMASAERVLSGTRGNFSRPLLSPDGATVVCSRRTATGDPKVPQWQSEILAVPWEGGPLQSVRSGYAVDVWQEPQTGRTWVYAFTTLRDGISSNPEGYRMVRFRLSEPDKEEVIWEKGLMSGDNIQLNRAGTAASGLIPWPNAGTFDFASGRFIRYRNGCWPSLAPDDSGVVWVFDGTHENLRLFLPGVEGDWRVPMGKLESLKGKAAYHPRWSNHPRVVCFTGPHPVKVSQGSGRVSVMLARFNAGLTAFEESVSLRNPAAEPDCYPDVWVAGGGEVHLDLASVGSKRVRELAAAAPAKAVTAWDAAAESLCFVWQRANTNNAITGEKRESSVTPHRHARFGPRFDMLTQGGYFVLDDASAKSIRKALTSGLWAMEIAITPLAEGSATPQVIFRAGPDLEVQQSLHDFIIRIAGKDWQLGAGLSAGQTTHLAFGRSSTRDGPPTVWLNGQSQEARPVDTGLRAPLAPADTTEVQFGARLEGAAAWTGRLETIAFHASAPDPSRVAAHAAWWQQQLTGSTPPARTVVRARLEEASPRATPESIGTYRRSWTSALYKKSALISGPDPGATFGVAHWTILDGQPVTGPPGKPGEERELILEPMAGHPEMDSEHGSEEILPDGVPLFLDTGQPGA
jgi:hypothetical protein